MEAQRFSAFGGQVGTFRLEATWDTLFLQEFCMVDYHPCIGEVSPGIISRVSTGALQVCYPVYGL